jgi:hypothetical protein
MTTAPGAGRRAGLALATLVAAGCATKADRPVDVTATDAGPTTGEVTVQVTGPAPVAEASVLLVRDSENGGLTRAPDAAGLVVFHAVSPGFYRVEVRHPRGLAERRDVPLEAGASAQLVIGLRSAFLYRPEPHPPTGRYRQALAALFDRWKGGELLASVTSRPAASATEVLVGIARRSPADHLAVALHADARVADALGKADALALAATDRERQHLERMPPLKAIAVRPATRPIPADLARAVACTWRSAVKSAVPERDVAPEVVDGVRYTVLVPDSDGQPGVGWISADTETLDGNFLDIRPRLRVLRLMALLHDFADGHLPALQFEQAAQDYLDSSCRPPAPPPAR